MTELRRELTLLDATMINVGTMIASAIFIVPASVAASLPSPSLMLLVWVAGGAVSLLGALCVAELGAAFPEAGGIFVYLERAYGPVWGFLYAWTAALIINPASVAAIAVGFATYVGFFVPLGSVALKVVAVGSIAALTAINCLGVKLGARVQNVLTLLKIAALGALVVFAVALPGGSVEHFQPFFPAGTTAGLAGAFAVELIKQTTRLKEDTALGLVLATFFAVGICLVGMIQRLPSGNKAGIDKILFGQAAYLGAADVRLMAVVTCTRPFASGGPASMGRNASAATLPKRAA